ncbi:MAG: VOC family protein [Bryobacteraceae bacterium]|nr:VOC family protein [Bryobacteraceae bacterium]
MSLVCTMILIVLLHFDCEISSDTRPHVACADQAEVDEYWDKLAKAGATPTQCGWIKDPFGLSWQIVPRRFTELIRDKDPRKVKAVMEAMMTMVKLDVAGLERAYNEA